MQETSLDQCKTGQDANENLDCRMKGAAASLEEFWSDTLARAPRRPRSQLFTGAADTGCGSASSAVGPFYCPPDQIIYVDTAFFDQLRTQFGSSGGPLAQLYVVGHEWGHHIQNITGLMDDLEPADDRPDVRRRAARAAGRLLRRSLDRGCVDHARRERHAVPQAADRRRDPRRAERGRRGR